jgi:hypothetical protein
MKALILFSILLSPIYVLAANTQQPIQQINKQPTAQQNKNIKKIMKHGKKVNRFQGRLAPKK